MHKNGHSELTTSNVGLVISLENPWLAASPDDRVNDPQTSPPQGLVEYKNPSCARDMTINEACRASASRKKQSQTTKIQQMYLDMNHDYFFQVQCQLYCDGKEWCDFVVRTQKSFEKTRDFLLQCCAPRDSLSSHSQWWN